MQHKYHEDESQFNESQRHVINNNNNIYKVGSLKDEKKSMLIRKTLEGELSSIFYATQPITIVTMHHTPLKLAII